MGSRPGVERQSAGNQQQTERQVSQHGWIQGEKIGDPSAPGSAERANTRG